MSRQDASGNCTLKDMVIDWGTIKQSGLECPKCTKAVDKLYKSGLCKDCNWKAILEEDRKKVTCQQCADEIEDGAVDHWLDNNPFCSKECVDKWDAPESESEDDDKKSDWEARRCAHCDEMIRSEAKCIEDDSDRSFCSDFCKSFSTEKKTRKKKRKKKRKRKTPIRTIVTGVAPIS